jgi:hypothetical protein
MTDNNAIPIIAYITVIHLIQTILSGFVFYYSSDGFFEDFSARKGYNKTSPSCAVLQDMGGTPPL